MTEGWSYLYNAYTGQYTKTQHYFDEDGRSLCKRYLLLQKDGLKASKPNDACVTCMKRLEIRERRLEKNAKTKH